MHALARDRQGNITTLQPCLQQHAWIANTYRRCHALASLTRFYWWGGPILPVLKHEPNTAYERMRDSEPMPGVFEIGRHVSIGVAVAEIVLLAACSTRGGTAELQSTPYSSLIG